MWETPYQIMRILPLHNLDPSIGELPCFALLEPYKSFNYSVLEQCTALVSDYVPKAYTFATAEVIILRTITDLRCSFGHEVK